MIEHHIETFVGEWQVHKVPVEELDQVADSTPLRMFRRHSNMRLADSQAGDVNAICFSQHDRHSAYTATGI